MNSTGNHIEIREMTLDDIAEIALLEAADSTAPWDETSLFTYFLREDAYLVVAEEDSRIVGFAGILAAPPEADVLDITVRSDMRRKGYGMALLQYLFSQAPEFGINSVFLEVRVGNAPARRLYEKLGFTETGIRKNYYTDPREDAISMKLVIPSEETSKHPES